MKTLIHTCAILSIIFFVIPVEAEDKKSGKTSPQEFERFINKSQAYVHTSHDSARFYANAAIAFAQQQSNQELLAQAINNKGYIFYRWSVLDSAEVYLKRALDLSRQAGDSTSVGIAINRLGTVYWLQEKQILAKQFYEKARAIQEARGNQKELGRAVNNLANLYREWGDYQQAINLYLEARDHYQDADYVEGVAWLNFSLTILYKKLDEYQKALDAINASLETYREIAQTSHDSTGIMICYGQLGDIYNLLDRPQQGLKYHQRALAMRKNTGVKPAIADGFSGVGRSYYKLGHYEQALTNFHKSLEIREEANTQRGIETSLTYIGLIHKNKGQFDTAIDYLSRGLQVAKKLHERESISQILQALAQIHASQGDYEQAWALYQSHRAVQDSLMNAQISKRIASMQLQRQIDQQNAENEQLQRENKIKDLQLARARMQRSLLLVLGILVFAGIGVAFYIYRKKMQIKTLRGLIPICSHCKKIRNDKGYYEQLEQYISTHSDAQFSHGICHDCMEEHYPEYSQKETNLT